MEHDHLITSPHTLKHWPQELYLTDPVIDRLNRETWEEGGSMPLWDRACADVETRLANYKPIETDPVIDAAMRQLVIDGFDKQEELPELPPMPEQKAPAAIPGRRGRKGRRRR
jgi:trimethylamine:corrinoid methyltransferase-like protein